MGYLFWFVSGYLNCFKLLLDLHFSFLLELLSFVLEIISVAENLLLHSHQPRLPIRCIQRILQPFRTLLNIFKEEVLNIITVPLKRELTLFFRNKSKINPNVENRVQHKVENSTSDLVHSREALCGEFSEPCEFLCYLLHFDLLVLLHVLLDFGEGWHFNYSVDF